MQTAERVVSTQRIRMERRCPVVSGIGVSDGHEMHSMEVKTGEQGPLSTKGSFLDIG